MRDTAASAAYQESQHFAASSGQSRRSQAAPPSGNVRTGRCAALRQSRTGWISFRFPAPLGGGLGLASRPSSCALALSLRCVGHVLYMRTRCRSVGTWRTAPDGEWKVGMRTEAERGASEEGWVGGGATETAWATGCWLLAESDRWGVFHPPVSLLSFSAPRLFLCSPCSASSGPWLLERMARLQGERLLLESPGESGPCRGGASVVSPGPTWTISGRRRM